jgi:biotin carboxyl carrier protein
VARSSNEQPSEQPGAGQDVIARLADDVVPTLVARLERSRLGEIEVRQDGWRIRLRRNLAGADGTDQPTANPARRSERKSDRSADGAGDGRSLQLHSVDRPGLDVTSPAVGYFTPRDGVAAGSSVRGGDVIGYVEMLGVRHDVVTPEDALIISLNAEPGQAVEYGERLAKLEKRTGRPETAIKVEAEVTA